MRRLLILWLWLTIVSICGAQASENYSFRGQNFRLHCVKIGDKMALPLDDPEVKRLTQCTAASLQISTSGQTLYVFLPGRESYWTNGSGVFTRNGQEREAPGMFLADPAAMEPAALLEALGLRAYPQSGGSVQLASLVTDIAPLAPDSLEVKILTSAPLKFTSSEVEKGLVRVEIPEAAWDRPERALRLGEADLEVSGGDRANAPLVLLFRFTPLWQAKVKLGLTRELMVSLEPRQFAAPAAPSLLSEVRESVAADGKRELEFLLDKGTQFFWSLDPARNVLRIEFPATNTTVANATVLKTASYPISRYELTLPAGQGFEFYQNSDQPNSLRLRLGGTLKSAETSGTACMSGFIGGRGTIVLDPGHGGGDPGCCNRALGVWEKDITLDICLRLQQLLTAQGWRVEMTRNTDRDVTYQGSPDLMELQARADVANKAGSDLFVSVHCNASVSPYVRGSAIYWWKSEDRPLAESLDVLDGSLGFEQDGLIQNNFAVLRLTSMPAVLVETAFLTNPTEGKLLATPEIRQGIAEKLAEGLGRYMSTRQRQAKR